MNDRDPFSGPLAGITGRLQKLRDNNEYLRGTDPVSQERADGYTFEIGMLIDLLDQLAWEVADLLPRGARLIADLRCYLIGL